MRTAAICPTCATYTNSVCVIYDGPYLSNLGISPMSSLDDALQQINSVTGTFEKTANKSTNITADQSSNVKYPSVKAVYDWVTSVFGPALTFTPENVANKSINIVTDQSSNTKYPSVKAVYDWVTANFQSSLGFTPENVANKSTNVSLGTSNTLYPTQNAVKTYVDTEIAAIPVPDLQQVTNVGNTTTLPLYVQDDPLTPNVTVGLAIDTVITGEPYVIVQSLGANKTSILNTDKLSFSYGTGGTVINTTNLSGAGNKNIELPNASGTFALSVNGNAASTTGNVSVNLQSVLAAGNSLSSGNNFQGTNAGVGNIGSGVLAFGTSAGFGNAGIDVIGFGLDAVGGNTGNDVTAFGTGAAQGNTLSGVTVFSNLTLPTYADHTAAALAITVLLGATPGCTYLYHNQATNSIGAVRL